jgi:hypothetical protein
MISSRRCLLFAGIAICLIACHVLWLIDVFLCRPSQA